MHDLPPRASERVAPLGYTPMDTMHAELDSLLLRARTTADTDYVELLADIDRHLRAHFEEEDRWMRETDFPPRDCHIDEHAAVLRSSQGVLALARQGRLEPGRGFIDELARWFPAHADHLDSAVAAWMFKRQHGGRPVVLHRSRGPADRAR